MGFKKQLLLYFGRIELSDASPPGSTPPPRLKKKSRKGMGISVVYLSFLLFVPSFSFLKRQLLRVSAFRYWWLCGINQFQLRPAPPGYYGAFARLFQSRGWSISKFCAARRSGICQPRGRPRAFDTQVVSYPNITLYITLYRGFY